MANKQHVYRTRITWTGNSGVGTASYRAYSRDHEVQGSGKSTIEGSSDPSFRGDPARWNPEELLLASVAACHKLWYLGLCANAGVVVTAYEDDAEGTMAEEPGGAGQFTSIVLSPRVEISAASDPARAEALHHEAHRMCFIARSVNFPIEHRPVIVLRP